MFDPHTYLVKYRFTSESPWAIHQFDTLEEATAFRDKAVEENTEADRIFGNPHRYVMEIHIGCYSFLSEV